MLKPSVGLVLAVISMMIGSTSQLKTIFLNNNGNNSMSETQEQTVQLDSVRSGTGNNHPSYVVSIVSQDSNRLTCTLNFSSLAYGDTTSFSATETVTIAKAMCLSNSMMGSQMFKNDNNFRVIFFTVPTKIQANAYTISPTGDIGAPTTLLVDNNFGDPNWFTFAYATRQAAASTSSRIILFEQWQWPRYFDLANDGTLSLSAFRYRDDDGASFYIYGMECSLWAGASPTDLCMIWGQKSGDLTANTASIFFRKTSAFNPQNQLDYLNLNNVPYSCVLQDDVRRVNCVWQRLSDSSMHISSVDLAPTYASMGDKLNISQTTDLTTVITNLAISAMGALPFKGRLAKVTENGDQVLLIKDDTPAISYFVCIMASQSGAGFCDPTSPAKSIEIKLMKNNPGIVNPELFRIRHETFQSAPFIAAYYEASKNRLATVSQVFTCDDADDYYFNPQSQVASPPAGANTDQCVPHLESPDCDGNDVTAVLGYRANNDTYAYEACTVEFCTVCNDDVAVCQVCEDGYKPVQNLTTMTWKCQVCSNPRCAKCAYNTEDLCIECLPKYGNLTNAVETEAPYEACEGCNADWWNSDVEATITANECPHRRCSENCVLDGCTNSHECDTCAANWMHGPDPKQCSECDSNAGFDNAGYVHDGDGCVPVCATPWVVECPQPGYDAGTGTSGGGACVDNYEGDRCDRCVAGYRWASGNSNTAGPADSLDMCVLDCDPAVVFGCASCATTPNECDTCKPGWIKSTEDSIDCDLCDEANGFFFLNGDCQKCKIANCHRCNGDGETCGKCIEGYFGDTCTSCAPLFMDISDTCGSSAATCVPDCKARLSPLHPQINACTSFDEACRCEACDDGKDPLTNCAACPEGYNDNCGTCEPACDLAGCATCSAPNVCATCDAANNEGASCETCEAGFLWIQGVCAKDCTQVVANDNGKCNGGLVGCLTTANVCSSCATGYKDAYCDDCATGYIDDPEKTLGDPLTCVPRCDNSDNSLCNDCGTTPYGQCNNCRDPTNFRQITTGTNPYSCELICDISNCAAGCSGSVKDVCSSCDTGYKGNACDECDDNYEDIQVGGVLTCAPICDSNCQANECTTPGKCNQAGPTSYCNTGYLLVKSDPGDTEGTCAPSCGNGCSRCDVPMDCFRPFLCAPNFADPSGACNVCAAGYHHPTDGSGNTDTSSCVPDCGFGCSSCSTPNVCVNSAACATGFAAPTGACNVCDSGYFNPVDGLVTDRTQCLPNCQATCDTNGNGCSAPNVCTSCNAGYNIATNCATCVSGYFTPLGAPGTCAPVCDTLAECDGGCNLPNICSSCGFFRTGDLCGSCVAGYENWPACTPICVNHCVDNDCYEPYKCSVCEEGYTGFTCSSCDRGYKRFTDGTCIACNIPGCDLCSAPGVCAACYPGTFLTQDKSRCLPTRDVCKPNIAGCSVCASNSKCSQCAQGLNLIDDGAKCVGESLFCTVEKCNSCDKQDHCEFCAAGYEPTEDGSECVFDCDIEHCASCNEDDTCAECDIGFYRNADNTTCLEAEEVLPEIDEQVYIRDEGSAFVEFSNPAVNLPYREFSYQFVDELTGETKNCPPTQCSAKPVEGREKALQFTFDTDFSMKKGYAIVTYKVGDVKLPETADKRRLQANGTSAPTKQFTIKNIVLSGDGKADRSARDAFIAINAIRVFATVILGVCNTAHAFWSTNLFSWLQLWAVLRGPFLTYPDRFLTWHYKWYLIAINFGDPFKEWDDWSESGVLCKASEEYPLSRLGCSISETFGQNLIVIVCIMLFCFTASVILFTISKFVKSQGGKRWISRLQSGLALTYFTRFMMAIMPSLIYFSVLQFYTHKDTPHMAFGVIVAFACLVWYSLITVLTYLLSKKIWAAVQKNSPSDISMESVARRYGGLLSGLAFQFNDLKNVTAFWQLQYPVVEYFRVFLISVFMITLGEDAGTSLGFVFTIEVLRFAFQLAQFTKKTSVYYAIADAFAGFWFVLYLILKMASTDPSMTEQNRQEKLGMAMAVFVCFQWAIILIDIVYDSVIGLKRLFSSQSEEEDKARKYEEGPNDLQDGAGKQTAMDVQAYPGSANRPN